ncbi:hypothetical protein SDRG_09855 [Saprolegnia diclina VS20]|uniref:Uncharacterized protein n=1 Tax=Saprolegnia diclina (strain VS20) TaxID=1156394 RepID=T0Q3Z1_SAPDV|nr:hypothetical protein SDRG_09855 [Saprolegnia diclina VS20]EQC32529.1 hypothetical protein SDRG_09855 [Saprolegnia diclina VS20]|eukprot:XP_008614030.1 hypothetical protein SDRG_09855 [Saprolegnia diclina VS20]
MARERPTTTKDERKKASQKAYYEANKEKMKAWMKAWQAKNKDYLKGYYEANKEKKKAQMKAHREANREFRIAYERTQRLRKKAIAAGEVPPPLPTLKAWRAAATTASTTPKVTAKPPAASIVRRATEQSVVKPVWLPPVVPSTHPLPCCEKCATSEAAKTNAATLTSENNTAYPSGPYLCHFCDTFMLLRRIGELPPRPIPRTTRSVAKAKANAPYLEEWIL